MTKNELKFILKMAKNVELLPLIVMIMFFAIYAWVDNKV